MTKKIFKSIFLVAIIVLSSCLVLIMGGLYKYFGSVQKKQLKTELALICDAVETGGQDYLENLDLEDCRLTYILYDGTVLYDSRSDAGAMENHAERKEIKMALDKGIGESSRYSATLTEKTLYYAKRLSDGNVLRISVSRMTILALVLGMIQPIAIVLMATLVFSVLLAGRMSKKIVEPLNALNLDKPLENDAYDEISPLLTHIEQQHRQIRIQKEELQERKNEFYAVIRNMNEGLVLLNRKGIILSINPAAVSFFSTDNSCMGKDFLVIERSTEVGMALKEAESNGRSELTISKEGREYQMNVSRIVKEEQTSGMVILIFDITERVFAERNRQEFTANVSHELKTPLQSIMGSAELIEKGLVKQEDMSRFVGHIRSEASRLVALIQDIIRLSQLDEKTKLPMEDVNIYELAKSEAESFVKIAGEKSVTVTVKGENAIIQGVHQLVHEIIYNLLDNAIKYNVEGGNVEICVTKVGNGVNLSVADTGMGIPPEHQNRIFERFYRVDKSHSKETGGTGLGLSIVKHAVQYMNGKITLESNQGKGTKIMINFYS